MNLDERKAWIKELIGGDPKVWDRLLDALNSAEQQVQFWKDMHTRAGENASAAEQRAERLQKDNDDAWRAWKVVNPHESAEMNLADVVTELQQRAERAEAERNATVRLLEAPFGVSSAHKMAKLAWENAAQDAHLAEAMQLLEDVKSYLWLRRGPNEVGMGLMGKIDVFLSSTPADSLARVRAMEAMEEKMRKALITTQGGQAQCRGCWAYLDERDKHTRDCWAKDVLAALEEKKS